MPLATALGGTRDGRDLEAERDDLREECAKRLQRLQRTTLGETQALRAKLEKYKAAYEAPGPRWPSRPSAVGESLCVALFGLCGFVTTPQEAASYASSTPAQGGVEKMQREFLAAAEILRKFCDCFGA